MTSSAAIRRRPPNSRVRASRLAPVLRAIALSAVITTSFASQPTDGNDFRGLDSFYRDLERLEQRELHQVQIVQLGDSHTAADLFSGQLRALLQSRFGNAGRGTVPAGLPYPGALWSELTVTQTGRWTVFNSRSEPISAAYGIAGFQSASTDAESTMTATMSGSGWFDRCAVDFVHGTRGAMLEVRVDGRRQSLVSTFGTGGEPGHIALHVPGSHQLQLVARGRDVRISDWTFQRDSPGVILNSFGVTGSTVNIINQWNRTEVAATLRNLHPSLLIVAYGTNEGHQETIDNQAYARTFTSALELLHALAPDASILVVGPPDSQRPESGCSQGSDLQCAWYRPGALSTVRDVQRQVARDQHAAFWNWDDVMRPQGGMQAWVASDPPLARPDHVHLTAEGYRRTGQALYDWLMQGYADHGTGDAVSHP